MLKRSFYLVFKVSMIGLFMSSCSTLKSISTSTKSFVKSIATPGNNQRPWNSQDYVATDPNTIEFLENISVKPGTIYLKKASNALDGNGTVRNTATNYEAMPANMSDVEKANWLQLKYSIKMDVAVEEIRNIPLLQKIDEWWGTPYCLGGSSKGCIDCSYFTLDVMKNIYDINLKRTAAEQYEQCQRIEWTNLKEGDLIFFKTEGRRTISHVGIYLTNNKFAHASTSQGVTISDLADPYWQRRLFSLGRASTITPQ